MRVKSRLLALTLAAALQPAVAGVVSLNFEDIASVDKLAGAYPSNQSVSFTGGAWGVSSRFNGCSGTVAFVGNGSCGAVLLGLDPKDDVTDEKQSFTIDLVGGFTEFSFAYSARLGSAVKIELFDDSKGLGNLLNTLSGLTEANCGTTGVRFCNWNTGRITSSTNALSVKVTGIDQAVLLDDFSFVQTAPGRLPEPGSIALALSALGALAWARKRASR